MKKLISLLLALVMCFGCAFTLISCGDDDSTDNSGTTGGGNNNGDDDDPPPVSDGVMSYEDFIAAEMESKVVVETYVQAKQSWWFNSEKNTGLGTFYMQSPDGAYFVYEMPCTEEEYNTLTVGTKVKITGYKTAWEGEVEIIDATYEILDGNYIAPAIDASGLLASDDLINYQNFKVSFNYMQVVASNDAGDAFLYKWNGSGSQGDDIYFKASVGGKTYTFVIESYLCGKDTDVYKAAESLKVGDFINMEGFLYWYAGAQPHITSIEKLEGVDTYTSYSSKIMESQVSVVTYVQAKQSWWYNSEKSTGLGTFYMQSPDGAYFVYEMPCTEEEYNSLEIGSRVLITGYKTEWEGEPEIIDATFKKLEGSYIAKPINLSLETLSGGGIVRFKNYKAAFEGLEIVASNDSGAAFLYKWNGSGSEGDDIYFKVKDSKGSSITLVIESYLCGKDTEVYKAAQALKVGDIINIECFLYWYGGVQPHVTSITK